MLNSEYFVENSEQKTLWPLENLETEQKEKKEKKTQPKVHWVWKKRRENFFETNVAKGKSGNVIATDFCNRSS